MASEVLYQRDGADAEEDGDSDAWDDTMLIKAYDNAVSVMKAKLAAQHPEYSASGGATASKKKKKSKQKVKKKKPNRSKSAQNWTVGDYCQAEFSEDGHIYSAQIISVDDSECTCVVKYVGYGNEEEQNLDSLLPPLSEPSSQDNKTDTASEAESTSDIPKDKQGNRRKSSRGTYVGGQSSKHRTSAPGWGWNNFTVPPAPPPPPSSGHHFPTFPPPPSFPHSGFGPSSQFPHMFPGIPPPPPMFNNQDASTENEALYSMLISWYMSGYHTGYYQGLKSAKSSAMFSGPHR